MKQFYDSFVEGIAKEFRSAFDEHVLVLVELQIAERPQVLSLVESPTFGLGSRIAVYVGNVGQATLLGAIPLSEPIAPDIRRYIGRWLEERIQL